MFYDFLYARHRPDKQACREIHSAYPATRSSRADYGSMKHSPAHRLHSGRFGTSWLSPACSSGPPLAPSSAFLMIHSTPQGRLREHQAPHHQPCHWSRSAPFVHPGSLSRVLLAFGKLWRLSSNAESSPGPSQQAGSLPLWICPRNTSAALGQSHNCPTAAAPAPVRKHGSLSLAFPPRTPHGRSAVYKRPLPGVKLRFIDS